LMFEAAAVWRDRIAALDRLREKQKVVASPDAQHDVFALYTDDVCSCLDVFYIREGSVVDSAFYIFTADQIVDGETLTAFICDLYTHREFIPREVLLGFDIGEDGMNELTDYIRGRTGKKNTVRVPERGELRALCDMVYDNAKLHADYYKNDTAKDNEVLVKLASMLGLEVVPDRIEAFDISNLGSEHITAGMIVCENGKLKKSDYRSFNIAGSGHPDDYDAMREAVERRLSHRESAPDLILLDGGNGHVSVIRELIAKLGRDEIPVFGMVKDDYHKTRALTTDSEEISIARDQAVFQFIYKLQEEVHRFTVSKMSQAKSRSLRTSTLTRIDGIGEVKAKALLAKFGSMSAIAAATLEQLTSVRGISDANADAIQLYFKIKQ
ncbi:MAG: helix-hairpin-helix domain-containing protein, partial [Eubacteriales bacterium]